MSAIVLPATDQTQTYAHTLSLTHIQVSIIVLPATPDDPTKRQPDITRARDLLGWEPSIPLEQGLRYMIEDFRKRGVGKKEIAAKANAKLGPPQAMMNGGGNGGAGTKQGGMTGIFVTPPANAGNRVLKQTLSKP